MDYSYMISDRYVRAWTIPQAIRELISNAIDASRAKNHLALTWEDGWGTITNRGVRMLRRHLMVGESDKNEGDIGQFGEGLKLAALVLVREGRQVEVRAGVDHYAFHLVDAADFDCRTLGVTVTEARPAVGGTRVRFQCSEDEFRQARGMFRRFNATKVLETHAWSGATNDTYVLGAPGVVYVLGVRVTHIGKAVFGYDLRDKALVNRDRTVVGQDALREAVRSELCALRDAGLIRQLLTAARDDPEVYERGVTPYPRHAEAWRTALRQMFGKKYCVTSEDPEADSNAQYLGHKIIDVGHGLNRTLALHLGVPEANDVKAPKVTKQIAKSNMNAEQRKVLRVATANLNRIHGEDVLARLGLVIKVTDDQALAEEMNGQLDGNTVWIGLWRLENIAEATGTLCHEVAHRMSNSGDCSAAFERALTRTIALFTENVLMRSHKKPGAGGAPAATPDPDGQAEEEG